MAAQTSIEARHQRLALSASEARATTGQGRMARLVSCRDTLRLMLAAPLFVNCVKKFRNNDRRAASGRGVGIREHRPLSEARLTVKCVNAAAVGLLVKR